MGQHGADHIGLTVRCIAIDLAAVVGQVVLVHSEGAGMPFIGDLRVFVCREWYRTVLVRAFRPIAARDHFEVVTVAAAGFAHYHVENILPVLQPLNLSLHLGEFAIHGCLFPSFFSACCQTGVASFQAQSQRVLEIGCRGELAYEDEKLEKLCFVEPCGEIGPGLVADHGILVQFFDRF